MNTSRVMQLCVSTICIVVVPIEHAYGDTFGTGTNSFSIEFVTIGDAGNVADTTGNPNPAGAVKYDYRIGKYEISEQMIDKANTLGGLSIGRDDIRGPNKAVTSVSWNDAARFVNWLNITTGSVPAYKFEHQPGEDGYVVDAEIQEWAPTEPGYNLNNHYRNSLARYFLPNTDEWYKAAYYDPTTGTYFNYATGSDDEPTAVASGREPNTAVYCCQSSPADIMVAGGLSPYGTMAQGGNVYEWQETDADLVNGPTSDDRSIRGGGWHTFGGFTVGLLSSQKDQIYPSYEGGVIGFRVASVPLPEPNQVVLAVIAVFSSWPTRRRLWGMQRE